MATPEQLKPAQLPELQPDELADMGLPVAISRFSIDHEADRAILQNYEMVKSIGATL